MVRGRREAPVGRHEHGVLRVRERDVAGVLRAELSFARDLERRRRQPLDGPDRNGNAQTNSTLSRATSIASRRGSA